MVATVNVDVQAVPAGSQARIPEVANQRLVYSMTRDETDGYLAVKFELSGDAIYNVDYIATEIDRDTIQFSSVVPAGGPVTGTATFFPGESTVQFAVNPKVDSLVERDEDIVVTIKQVDELGPIRGGAALIAVGQDTVYHVIDNQNQLAIVDTETGTTHVIGTMDVFQNINDIAFTKNGDLFAISADHLYQVFPDMVSDGIIPTTFMGFHGILNANALVDSRSGDFGSQVGDLFAVGQTFLDLQRIDIEKSGSQFLMNNVTTVFDIDGALASLLLPSDYISSGDLDYDIGGNLVLSVMRPADSFDSLVTIRTPGTAGLIDTAPKKAEDPGETFSQIRGFAFDANDSFGFAGYTMLRINQFSHDASRELEITGRTYIIGGMASAIGTIIGDPVDPPVVTLNAGLVDPDDLAQGPQPTTWTQQKSELRDLFVQLGATIDVNPLAGITLTNLGVTRTDTPQVVGLTESNIRWESGSDNFTITFDPGQLSDGKYELMLAPVVSQGPQFTMTGDRTNGLYVLKGDWDGNGIVDLRDFNTFAYWYGKPTTGLPDPVAPEYVDLNRSGDISEGDFAMFHNNLGRRVELPGVVDPVDPALIDETTLMRLLQSAINPLDVNGSTQVTPLDALNVLNRLAANFATVSDWRFDVNRDGTITPRDALQVLNALSIQSAPQPSADPVDVASLIVDFINPKRDADAESLSDQSELIDAVMAHGFWQ
ncbi:MAG: hypothetical protein KDB00_08235 [Planctomycetales bacterium]|nr:hypothetical protein [Planctomycetales bacterium]